MYKDICIIHTYILMYPYDILNFFVFLSFRIHQKKKKSRLNRLIICWYDMYLLYYYSYSYSYMYINYYWRFV